MTPQGPAPAADAIAPVSAATSVVMLPSRGFVGGCAVTALALLSFGRLAPIPGWILALEVLATILGLFVFGSFRYQIHKNALTYGMLLVVAATFVCLPTSTWHVEIARSGWRAWTRHHLVSFSGLDDLIPVSYTHLTLPTIYSV